MSTNSLFTVMQSLTRIMVVCCLVINFTTGSKVGYITGKLTGCVNVKKEPTCRIDYPVPNYFAKQFHQSLKVIQYILPNNGTMSKVCRKMFRKLFCGQKFPRCVNSSYFDFGNASSLCARLHVCIKPDDYFIKFVVLNYCKLTQSGLYKSDRCVDIPTNYVGKTCAKHYKLQVPIWIADRYRKRTKINKLANATSTGCNGVQGAGCKIPFCSSNGKYILTVHTKQKCMVWSKCLFGNSTARTERICNSFPDENKAKKIYLV